MLAPGGLLEGETRLKLESEDSVLDGVFRVPEDVGSSNDTALERFASDAGNNVLDTDGVGKPPTMTVVRRFVEGVANTSSEERRRVAIWTLLSVISAN